MISLWAYYVDNVDILVKILHRPSVEALIMSASRNLEGIDTTSEPLLFAIWFASVVTMSAEECRAVHKGERGALLRKYRYGLEKALVQAEWMTTQDIVVLQALTLLIVRLDILKVRLLRTMLTPLGFRAQEECSYELDAERDGHECRPSYGFTS